MFSGHTPKSQDSIAANKINTFHVRFPTNEKMEFSGKLITARKAGIFSGHGARQELPFGATRRGCGGGVFRL
jgi:hypothetical protein